MICLGGQCRRSNAVCQGYPSEFTFVQYTPSSADPSNLLAAQRHNEAPLSIADRPLMNSAADVYMFDNYWNAFFPKANVEEKKFVPTGDMRSACIPASWIFDMRDFCCSDLLIKTGLQANAYSTVGKKTTEKRLSVAGMQAYALALKEVNRRLEHGEKRKKDSLLAACKLLAIYEVSSC